MGTPAGAPVGGAGGYSGGNNVVGGMYYNPNAAVKTTTWNAQMAQGRTYGQKPMYNAGQAAGGANRYQQQQQSQQPGGPGQQQRQYNSYGVPPMHSMPPPQMQAPSQQVLGAPPMVEGGPSEGTSSNSSQHGGDAAAAAAGGVAVNGGTPVAGMQAIQVQPGAAAEYRNMAQPSVSPHQPQPAGPQIYQPYMVDGLQSIMGE